MNQWLQKSQKLFSPPVFPGDDEKTRLAVLLNTTLLSITLGMLFLVLGGLLGHNVRPLAFVVMLLVFLLMLGLQIPMRRGFVRQASLALVILLTVSVTGFIILNGSIRMPGGPVFMILASVMAGLLVSRRAALVSAVIDSLIIFVLMTAEIKGWLPPPILSVTVAQGIAFMVGAILTVVLLNLATRSIDESLAQARAELAERQRIEQREQYRREMLEKVIRLGKIVTEQLDYRTTLLNIRNGIQNDLGFDRVGLFIYDAANKVMQGSYGSNRAGALTEEWQLRFAISGNTFFPKVLSRPDGYFFTEDYEKEQQLKPGHIMAGVKNYAAVSAWAGDKPIAIICVDQLVSGRVITDAQLEALRFFAGYAGLAIENARLVEREKYNHGLLEKVIQLGKVVTEVADYRTVLLRIWHGVHDDLGFDRVGLFIYEASSHTIQGSYGTNRDGRLIEEWHLRFSLSEINFFSKVLAHPDGCFYSTDYEHEPYVTSEQNMSGVKHYAAVSAWAGDKPVAIICVDQLVSGRVITDEQLEALRFFAGYAGLAIENARLDRREQTRQTMLEKVIRLGKIVTEVTDFRASLLKIWEGVRADLDFDRVGLFLYDQANNTMQGAYGTDRSGELFEAWQVRFGLDPLSLFHQVLSQPDGLYVTENLEKEQNLPSDHEMFGVKAYAAVAVWAGDKPVAIIAVDQLLSGRGISAEQLEALRLFNGYAGLAIENARLNTELEQRVEERTTQLEAANRELEAFSYSVSHDLRAPLRAINSFSQILLDDFSTGFDPLGRNFLQKIVISGKKMNLLIDDLLDFSRLGRKPLKLEPVDLNELVQTVIEASATETAHRQIEWVLAKAQLPSVTADPVLLRQVYANLIGNAVKYTGKRALAHIEIGAFAQADETIYFVRDNGAGFDMQYADKLFGVFQRLHREDEFEGTGIGLATVKRIIQRHGGRIWAEAAVDEGATFYFTLSRY